METSQLQSELEASHKREAELLHRLEAAQSVGPPSPSPHWPRSVINTVLKLPSQLGMTQLTNQQLCLGAEQLLEVQQLILPQRTAIPHSSSSHLMNPRFPGDEISLQAPRSAGSYGQAFTGDLQPSRVSGPERHRSTRDISSDDLDGPCLQTHQLESLARDIEQLDPSNRDTNVEDYIREVERCLLDLPHPSSREKLKLLWKTTTRSVNVFMESLPPGTRDRYSALCQALRDEYSLFTDTTSATLHAFAITQRKQESPKETRHLPMQEIRRYAQIVWEIRVRPAKKPENDARVLGIQAAEDADLALEGSKMPRAKTATRAGPQRRQAPNRVDGRNKGGGMRSEMKELIRVCLAEVVRQLDLPSHSTSPKVYFVGWGRRPGEVKGVLKVNTPCFTDSPFLAVLGDLVRKGNARRTYTSVVIGGCVSTLALLDSRSEISLMSSDMFKEVARAMLSLCKPLQIETCNISITSHTQVTSPITRRAWVDVTFQEMTLVHPIYICILDTEPSLIEQDLLDRLAPLNDCHRGHIWALADTPKPLNPAASVLASDSNVAESRTPLPMLMPLVDTSSCSGPSTPPVCPQPTQSESPTFFQDHRSFLCSMKNVSSSLYSPYVIGGVHLNGTLVPEAILTLWSEKSTIDQDLFKTLCQHSPSLSYVQRSHRVLSAGSPQTLLNATGVCSLTVRIGKKQVMHYISVVPHLQPPFTIWADLLVRLSVQLDTVNQVLWFLAGTFQVIPQACQVASEIGIMVPARTVGFPIRLAPLKGQKIPGLQAFFQPLPRFQELNLTVCGMPLLELNNCSTYLLVQNLTHVPIQVTAWQLLDMLVDSSFHDFELSVPVMVVSYPYP
ncbi:hypothetical protein ABVT39_020166 [Epinephelus coioides]